MAVQVEETRKSEPEIELQRPMQATSNVKAIIFRVFLVVFLLGAALAGYFYWKDLQRFESTDDAQVDGSIYTISSRISGHVADVLIQDEQVVKAGDVLVRLDPKDYEVAIAKARADLADAIAMFQSHANDIGTTQTTTARHAKRREIIKAGRQRGGERSGNAKSRGAGSAGDSAGECSGGGSQRRESRAGSGALQNAGR